MLSLRMGVILAAGCYIRPRLIRLNQHDS